MKKIILILTFIYLPFFSYAQTKERYQKKGKQSAGQYLDHAIDDVKEAFHRTRYIVFAGGNYSKVTKLNHESILGFCVGAGARILAVESIGFSIQPELILESMGSRPKTVIHSSNLIFEARPGAPEAPVSTYAPAAGVVTNANASSIQRPRSISNLYLCVPVMLFFAPKELGGVYLEGGPKFGLAINKGNFKGSIKANSFDFSLAFGLGIEFKIADFPGEFGVGGRYNLGLTNVYKLDPVISNKNSSFSAGLKYIF